MSIDKSLRRKSGIARNRSVLTRDERIKSMKDLAAAYLEEYRMRHRSFTFAEYAVGNVTRHLGELMAVDVTDKIVLHLSAAGDLGRAISAHRQAIMTATQAVEWADAPIPGGYTTKVKVEGQDLTISLRKV